MGITLNLPVSQAEKFSLNMGHSPAAWRMHMSHKMCQGLKGNIQTSPVSMEMGSNCIQRFRGRRDVS